MTDRQHPPADPVALTPDPTMTGNTIPDAPAAPPARGARLTRHWPYLLLALLILVVAVWALARRGTEAPTASPAATQDSAGTVAGDSIIRLDSAARRLANVTLVTVSPGTSGALVANGTITYDANRVSVIASRTEGRIVSVAADLGQSVRAGARLATAQSAEVGQTRGDLARARATMDVARRNYEREQRLFAEQITPQKELLDAEGAFRTAEADYNAAVARLRAVGASTGEGATFALVTPVAGTVVERNASPGQTVGPSTNVFTVADLRHVWITVDVYEGDLARVREGARAFVIPTALPDASFPGTVTYAGGIVDSATRTFKVRVEVDNPARRLRPGMFAQVRIQTPPASGGAGAGGGSLIVPEIAVQEVAGKRVVFVARPAAGEYVARPVTVGPRAGDGMVVITGGLRQGDRIVTTGAFQLKATLTAASLGAGD